MPYVDVTVDVDIDIFEDQELIDELENRGWWVSPEKNWEPDESLSDEEKDWVCSFILDNFNRADGDEAVWEIYEKLRKR
jgi:hypothetical protein